MKSGSKLFGISLVAAFAGALSLTYIVANIMESTQDADGRDFTRGAMAIGGLGASWILAIFSGWRFQSLGILLVVSLIVSGLFSGNAGGAFIGVAVSAFLYFTVSKIHNLTSYYRSADSVSNSESTSIGDS